jgi:hypothetical protein
MEMQQIIGMLAKMQEKADANTRAMLANQAKADAHQAKMEARMDANTKAMQENQETTARMYAKMGSMRDELKRPSKE